MTYDIHISPKNPNGNIVEQFQDWMWSSADWTCTSDWITHSQTWFSNWGGRPKRVCVQAGGFIGVYPRMLAEQFEKVYTFEPTPISFHCLTNNCQKNNIFKFQAAVGETCQRVSLTVVEDNMAINTILENYEAHSVYLIDPETKVKFMKPVTNILVQQLTIDTLSLDVCDLIALDVEGYELQALKGAENTIKKFWPRIITEKGDKPDLSQWLKNLGYNIECVSICDTVWDSSKGILL